ncbi:diguanylate cyclase [Paenibacillus sp. TRM 82003]|nr:diguanylate cyclase [Paenibacillus sp. TRM 82003]
MCAGFYGSGFACKWTVWRNVTLFHDLIINGAFLIAMIHLGSLYYRYRLADSEAPTWKEKLFLGFACGLAGIVLMTYTVRISDTTILDFRHIAIVLAATNGGLLASALCGLIISAFRLSFFGVTSTAIIASVNVMIYALIGGWIYTKKWRRQSAYTVLSGIAIISTCGVFLLALPPALWSVTLSYYVGFSIFGGILVYLLMENIIVTNALFQRFKQQSTTDFLTGLSNVRRFDKVLNDMTRKAVQRQENLSLLMIDIDFFKSINDTYGHKAGDEVLRELGNVLSTACRSVDTVSRNGGEEFSVLLPDCPIDRALEVAERVREAVAAHEFSIGREEPLRITVSIGAATYPELLGNPEELLQKADDGLYKAKRTGRNRVCVAM